MKILSSFTNPLEQLFGTIDFHSRKKNTMEVNCGKVPIILQNIFLCIQQKKETAGLQQLEGEYRK